MSWPKHLSVDKRIVTLLSASTYENFPRAMRELVSNSYDADATLVKIEISRDKSEIVIKDNGAGMTPDEFDFFLRIAGHHRRISKKSTRNRKRIGQFGIGFLAMFPFCRYVEVESTIDGSPIIFNAKIPAERFCRVTDKIEDVADAQVVGKEYRESKKVNDHYTTIRLCETTDLFKRYLNQKSNVKNTIKSEPGLEKLKWELQDILPLRYARGSLVSGHIRQDEKYDFRVFLNGSELFSNDYVEDILDYSKSAVSIGGVEVRYVIGTPWKAVQPYEARGLRIRLNGVGVGPRTHFDLGIAGRTFSRLHWLTGEVNITSGLDDSITLDRDKFSSSQSYEDFKDFFREKLRKHAYDIESIDEAKRKISAQTRQSSRSEIASSKVVIKEHIQKLKKKGFTVKESNKSPSAQTKYVEVNLKQRSVYVPRNYGNTKDSITVAGINWIIDFDSWDESVSINKACKIVGNKKVLINEKYSLFSGKNKDFFRRMQILLAYAESISRTKKDFSFKIQELILKEFKQN